MEFLTHKCQTRKCRDGGTPRLEIPKIFELVEDKIKHLAQVHNSDFGETSQSLYHSDIFMQIDYRFSLVYH